jgi:hypothetical protein
MGRRKRLLKYHTLSLSFSLSSTNYSKPVLSTAREKFFFKFGYCYFLAFLWVIGVTDSRSQPTSSPFYRVGAALLGT